MTIFVIVRGPLGVGKTTISKKLALKLKAKYISIDDILLKNHLDKSDAKQGCIPVENFIKAQELILSKVMKLLESGKPVVFDGCFYHKKQIQHLISKLKFKHFIFTLKAPLEVCIERDSKRKKTYGIGAAKAVYTLVSRFDSGIAIDASEKTAKDVVGQILSKIG